MVEPAAPCFHVGDVPVYGRLVLAPMAGFSDKPFRVICREHGSAMSYTEFVGAGAILNANYEIFQRLEYDPAELPQVSMQLFGQDVDQMVGAAQRLQGLGPGVIDVNMGCSVHDVTGRGAGAALLRHPAQIGRIFRALAAALDVPVTGKIRLGWEATARNYREVAHVLEDSGAALIAVHGRTKDQNYSHRADWDAIAEVKQSVRVPVIGNGDVRTLGDIERMFARTGVDAIMIGRGAIGNPWLFQYRDLYQVPLAEKMQMVRRHLAAMLEYYGDRLGLLLFRKHMARYARGIHMNREHYIELMQATEVDAFLALIAEHERREAG